MLFWKKFMNWLNAPSNVSVNAQTAGMVGLATMSTPAATVAVVQAAHATPSTKKIGTEQVNDTVDTATVPADDTPVKVKKKARTKSAEPRVKKPRAPRKPKTDVSNTN